MMTRFKAILFLFIIILPLSLSAENKKIDEDEDLPPSIIAEKDLEEEIIKYLDLLKNYNIVENLKEFEVISEMIEYEEDYDE